MTKKVIVIRNGCTAVPEVHVEEREDDQPDTLIIDDDDDLEGPDDEEISYDGAMPEIHSQKLNHHH